MDANWGGDSEEYQPQSGSQTYQKNISSLKDQRDAVQKKTFTKWVNKHLAKVGVRVNDLFEDLRDGHNLITLLEVLSERQLPREKGRLRFHSLQNVKICLEFLEKCGIKLVNIRPDEIVDGNPKLTLGLIWTIILQFQISDIMVQGHERQDDTTSAKKALLLWSQQATKGYPGVEVKDFTTSWRDGKAFLSIIHRHKPELIAIDQMPRWSNKDRLANAFDVADRNFGVTKLLDPEDVDVDHPDEKSVITYVSSLYDALPEMPAIHPLLGQSLMERDRRNLEDYRSLQRGLVKWIRDAIEMMNIRNFPPSIPKLKALLADLFRFKQDDIPPRLNDIKKAQILYAELQSSNSTIDIRNESDLSYDLIERCWDELMNAVQYRKDAIQQEIEKLDMMAERMKEDEAECDNNLSQIEQKIIEDEEYFEQMSLPELQKHCHAIQEALEVTEQSIQSLLANTRILKDAEHPQFELHAKRSVSVGRLDELWGWERSLLHSRD